ncbi:hypothetical protein ACET3Z_003840 [Daucus carota]
MPSEGRSRYNDKQEITPITVHARNIEIERNQAQCVFHGYHCSFAGISKSSKAGLVAVGWVSWVVKDGGEDLMGWVPRKEKSFHILDNIREDDYNIVYRTLDLEKKKIVALKKITFNNLAGITFRPGLKSTEPQIK